MKQDEANQRPVVIQFQWPLGNSIGSRTTAAAATASSFNLRQRQRQQQQQQQHKNTKVHLEFEATT